MSQETPESGRKNRAPQVPSPHHLGPGERDAAQAEPDRRSLTLVDGIPGVVWEAYGQPDAAQQRIDFISPAVETMLGYSVREWLDTPNFWLSIVHPDDRARAAAIAADAFARGVAHTNQFRWLTKDGRTLWVESHSTVVRDEGGAPIGMRGVTLDVTARKEAEDELRQHLEDLSRMQQVSTRLMQAGNFADLLRDILAAAIEITGAHMGNIQLLNGDTLRIAVHQGLSDAFLEFFDTVHQHQAVCGTALERGERVIVEDVKNSSIFLNTPALDVLLNAGVRAVQSTPLISRSGRRLGMFSTQYRHAPTRPSHRALRLLDILARQAADLIETRQTDEALRAKEAQLHRLISETPFMLTRCSRDLRYTFVSRAYSDMLGKTPSDIEGRPIVEIMGDEGFTTIRPHVDAVLSGTRVEYESDVRFAGVGQRSLRVVYVPDRATDGTVIGWIASILDVTQEKLTSDARRFLVELDDKVRPLIDPDEITFAAARALGEHLGVNRCAYAAVEEDEDTFLLTGNYNNGVGSIVGRYTFRQFGEECLRLMRAGEPYVVTDSDNDPRVTGSEKPSYEMTAIRAVICVPILKQGRFVAAMAVHSATPRAWQPDNVELVQRVAGRCWESIERARVTRELRESEHRFRALANSIANLAWMARPDGWIYWYNDQWFAYTGTTPADMEGWGWERVHDPAVLPSVKKQWQQSIDSGTPFEMVFPLRGADGHFRRFLTRVNPVRDSRGDVVQWFGTNTDVENERRATEANAELRERERLAREEAELLREAAEAANRAKDEFLAMLGHELRNPLSPILTALQLMKLRGSDASQRERTVIERQVNHLTRLVDDLLDVSRIASGRVQLKEEVVEMAAVVAKGIEMASPLLEQRAHSLVVEVPRHGLAVQGDPTRLSQVVSNLLTNAAKYTPAGGQITIRAANDGDDVVMRVKDTGMGIAPDVLPRVFDLFVQERQAIDRSQGGLGLGLTIVRSLVERHQGSVSAHSDGPSRGSEFTVRLPKALSSPELDARRPADSPVASMLSPDRRRNILIVDDNEDAAEMLAETLRMTGHETRVAHDGPAALQLAEGFRPDIAFLDIGLPVMDGYELAGRLRELPGLAGIRLVAVTGYGQESDRQKSRAAGFHHHLVKPVDFDAVQTVVNPDRQ